LPLGAGAGDQKDRETHRGGGVWDLQSIKKGSGPQNAAAVAPGGMEDREPVAPCAGRDLRRGPLASAVWEYPPGAGRVPERGDRADAERGAAEHRGGDALLRRPPVGGPRPHWPPRDFQIALAKEERQAATKSLPDGETTE